MKKLIICLFSILLFSSINLVSSQEYKYFDITMEGNSIVGFVPKHLKPGSMDRKNADNNWVSVVPKMNKYYFDTFIPIYKDVFGADFNYKGDRINLMWISCSFWFREDFKPYYYQISFPTAMLDEFPQWEEKLYQTM